MEKLEAINDVNRIVIEEIVDEKLKKSLEAEKPIIVKAYIDVNDDKIIDHFISFALTELVYDIETSHEWAVNNLIDMIEKNNAEYGVVILGQKNVQARTKIAKELIKL